MSTLLMTVRSGTSTSTIRSPGNSPALLAGRRESQASSCPAVSDRTLITGWLFAELSHIQTFPAGARRAQAGEHIYGAAGTKLLEAGSEANARAKGTLRLEGKD